jgi:hypothetical protein
MEQQEQKSFTKLFATLNVLYCKLKMRGKLSFSPNCKKRRKIVKHDEKVIAFLHFQFGFSWKMHVIQTLGIQTFPFHWFLFFCCFIYFYGQSFYIILYVLYFNAANHQQNLWKCM